MSSNSGQPPRFGLDRTPPLQLEFIDHADGNSRKRVRSHAMKDVQRRKRWDYARSADHKRRNEERKRSTQSREETVVAQSMDSVPPNRSPMELQQPLQHEFVYHLPAPDLSARQSQHQPHLTTHQRGPYEPQPPRRDSSQQIPIPVQSPATTSSRSNEIPHDTRRGRKSSNLSQSPRIVPIRSNERQRSGRSGGRGSPDDHSEPSLADDESTAESESRRENSYSSPESDKFQEQHVKKMEPHRDPKIADGENDYSPIIDTEAEEIAPKSHHQHVLRVHVNSTATPPHPGSFFSAARYDPFDSLAKKVKPEDRHLVDHRIYILPNLMFRVPSCCALSLVMAGPISFQASALAYSAAHLTRLHGKETPEAIIHKSTALQQLNQGVQSITLRSCLDVLYAILGLAMLEARFGDKSNAWLHMRGALQVMEKFRNDATINNNRDINFWVPWILITIEGYDPFALHRILHEYNYFYATSGKDESALSMTPHNFLLAQADPSTVTRDAIDEFLVFLRHVEHISLIHNTIPNRPEYPKWLFHVLSLPPGAREGVRGASIQTTSRLACLIYLNAALWEYRSSPPQVYEFIQGLESQVLDYKLGWTFSIEKLLHVMIEADMKLFTPGRSFFTARMMNVAKRLDAPTWDHVNTLLTRCMRMRFRGSENLLRDKTDSLRGWHEDLSRELYGKPILAHNYYPGP